MLILCIVHAIFEWWLFFRNDIGLLGKKIKTGSNYLQILCLFVLYYQKKTRSVISAALPPWVVSDNKV